MNIYNIHKTSRVRWKRSDSIIFFESLESYLSAGLSLDVCLQMIEHGSASHRKYVYARMRSVVEKGGLFSSAITEHSRINNTVASIIRHGEASGALVRSITLARSMLEHQDELIKSCVSALVYPCIIGFFAGVLTIGLVRGIMPQIIPMLKGLHVQLPVLTRVVMSISDIATAYGLYIICGVVVCMCTFLFLYRRYRAFVRVCHHVVVRIPVIGNLITYYVTSVFLHSCGALLDSGVYINQAYTHAVGTISFLPLQEYMASYTAHVNNGAQLSSVFVRHTFPVYVSALISAGESSGTLGPSCIRAASILDRGIQHSLKRMTSLIEPLMMVGMGLIIGSIALSILMPIYDLSRVLQK